jgi:A/G-specific adenine glycosylase
MLQQTQVVTVIPYYLRFVEAFPTVADLALASEEQVLAYWSGLGYYARGRNLHRAARRVVDLHDGQFPCQFEQILALPGVGRTTAAAICAQAYQMRYAILDGNVKRVLARYCGISGSPAIKSVESLLWERAELLLPDVDVGCYTQALMDMGATLCTRSRPKCVVCPVQKDCVAYQSGRVAELPTPRIRKAVPERFSTFLLVMHGGDVLLEKRTSSGIWGGMWCLPQLDEGQSEIDDYVQNNALDVNGVIQLARLTHTFTHFKLQISPVHLALTQKPRQLQKAVWMKVSEALSSAIPTPVRTLLAEIQGA